MPIGADTDGRADHAARRCAGSATSTALNMTCGASNVSFGMPDRHTLDAAFLPMAMTAGLTSAIMDARTPQIVEAVKAADLLLGHDEWGGSWIAAHREQQAATDRMSRHDAARAAGLRGRRPAPRGPDRPARTAAAHDPARRHRPGPAAFSPAEPRRPGAARASPSSTPRAGTASRSTPPAAATAPARSARCRSLDGGACRCTGSTCAPSRPDAAARRAGGWPASRRRPRDLRDRRAAADDPAQGRDRRRRPAGDPAAGRAEAVRRARPSRPSPTSAPTSQRLLDAIDDLELRADLHALRRLPTVLRAGRLQGHRGDRRRRR